MDSSEARDYTDMSLDDVIRDLKSRRRLEEGTEYGISPLLRSEGEAQPAWKYKFRYPKSEYSNYLKEMARKKVRNARQTLDLRRKLIHERTSRAGMDLRFKLVALVIARLRAKYGSFPRNRYQPYPTLQPAARPMGPPRTGFKMMGHPGLQRQRVKQSYVSQLEQLVGKLPAWMTKSSQPQPHVPSFEPECYEPQVNSGYHGGLPFSSIPGTEDRHFNDDPAPLVYAPPVPVRPVLNEEPNFYSKAIPFSCLSSAPTPQRPVPAVHLVDELQPPPSIHAQNARSAPLGIGSLPVNIRNPTLESLRELKIPIPPGRNSFADSGMRNVQSVIMQNPQVDADIESLRGGYSREALNEIVIEVENSGSQSQPMTLHERFSKSS